MSAVDDQAPAASAATAAETGIRRLFVSYSSLDVAVADDLVRQLELLGVPCWIAPRDIPAGADYASEIIPAIREASAVLFLYSEHSNRSKHCLREVETAVAYEIDILPIRLDSTPMSPGLEYRLSAVQWIDGYSKEALRSIAAAAARSTASVPTDPAEVAPIPREMRAPEAPLIGEIVGRERETRELIEILDAVVQSGRGRMVLLGGDSGVGKSALASHLVATAIAAGFRVSATTCGSFLDGVSFFPVREILRQLTDSSNDLLAYAKRLYGPTSQQAGMAAVIDSALADAATRREAMLATFANLVFGAANQRIGQPLLLFVDDMENIDAGSVDSLLCLLARIGDGPVLVVGAYRDDIVDRAGASHPLAPLIDTARRNDRNARVLSLAPLTKASYSEVIESLLGGPARLPRSVIDYLWDQTEGNVLFLREILRALSSETSTGTQPSFVQHEGGWRFRGSLDTVTMPRSVEEAIERNLEAVAASDRGYLETASVIGKQFRFDLALGVIGAGDDELLDALERCVASSLLRELVEPTDSFEFSHNRVREVLYSSLSHIRRRRIHSRVADALIASSTGRSDSVIGEHLYRAERFSDAAFYLHRSAVAMLAIRESGRAADQLSRVYQILARGEQVADLDPVDVGLQLIQALQESSSYAEGAELANRLAESPGIDGLRRGWIFDGLGDLEMSRGRIPEAIAAYEEAERLSPGHPELELAVCADLHELHDRQRERTAGVDDAESSRHAAAAVAYLDREVTLAEQVGSPRARARAYRNRAKSLRRIGEIDAALSMYEDSIAQTDPRIASHQVLISYAKTLRFAGRPDEAIASIQRVYDWSLQTGARRSEGIALYYRAMIEMDRDGATESAYRDLESALAIHEAIGYDRGRWEVRLLRGEWFALHGDLAAALEEFRAGIGTPELSEQQVVDAVRAQLEASDEHARAARLNATWSGHAD